MAKPRLDPRKERAKSRWDMDLRSGSLTMRRIDLVNEVMSGKLEARLLHGIQKFETLGANQRMQSDPAEVLGAMPVEDRQDILHALRTYARVAIVSPVVAYPDDGDPDHFPAETFSLQELIHIYNAAPPEDVAVDPDQPLAIPQSAAEVARFPEPPQAGSAQPESVVSHRDDSLPDVENVEVQTVSTPDGRVVKFAHG